MCRVRSEPGPVCLPLTGKSVLPEHLPLIAGASGDVRTANFRETILLGIIFPEFLAHLGVYPWCAWLCRWCISSAGGGWAAGQWLACPRGSDPGAAPHRDPSSPPPPRGDVGTGGAGAAIGRMRRVEGGSSRLSCGGWGFMGISQQFRTGEAPWFLTRNTGSTGGLGSAEISTG